MKIHIFGASGTGVTTLGKNLAGHFNIPFFDSDDYYWQKTDPPFIKSNPPDLRQSLISNDLSQNASWILSGSLTSWGEFDYDRPTLAIYLYVPKEERLKRIKAREKNRFGERIGPGGDMHETHLKFLDWAMQYEEGFLGGRSQPLHFAWMKTLQCPLIKIDEILSEKELFEKVLSLLPN